MPCEDPTGILDLIVGYTFAETNVHADSSCHANRLGRYFTEELLPTRSRRMAAMRAAPAAS